MKQFFENDETLKTILVFSNRVDRLSSHTEFEEKRTSCLLVLCEAIQTHPNLWDERCQVNINWIGDHLLHFLSERTKELTSDELDGALGLFFRFLLEFHLSTKNDIHRDLEGVRRFCVNNISLLSSDAQDDIRFALNEMPIALVKDIINSPEIENVRDLVSASAQFRTTKIEWDKELEEKEKAVIKLKDSLENYKNAFNFVGLSEGFDQLANEKRKEMKNVLWWLRIVAILIVCPLIGEILYLLSNLARVDELAKLMLLAALPTVSLMAILVYYFRILLLNYKSIQSQLLQIDLRMTLCRFIHNYSDYAGKMKKQDSSSLDKFENIIFSGITNNAENIPSTFDGIEQLGKLIKAVKP